MHRFQSEYEYYKKTLVVAQASENAYAELWGSKPVDLAYAKAMERAATRAAPKLTWAQQQERFKQELELRKYSTAISA